MMSSTSMRVCASISTLTGDFELILELIMYCHKEEVLLENVELILEAFDYLQLPFALKQGTETAPLNM